MAYIVIAHINMTYIVMAYITMAYIVIAICCYGLYSWLRIDIRITNRSGSQT